uniref:CR032 protein n=1 Tax=Schistosoma mansoni TaxID=6183 RepID=A0A146MI62_SCHMA
MVCIPCIVIPVLLWILHRLLYPVVYYFIPRLKPIPQPTTEKSEQLNDLTEDDVTNACQSSSPSKSKSE